MPRQNEMKADDFTEHAAQIQDSLYECVKAFARWFAKNYKESKESAAKNYEEPLSQEYIDGWNAALQCCEDAASDFLDDH